MKSLEDHRCDYCKKLFFKADLRDAVIEIKCRSCKKINKIIKIEDQ